MFIYIPRHLSKLELVSEMTSLLRGYLDTHGSSKEGNFDYYYYYYTIDPVKNFIRMCLSRDYGEDIPDGILWYLIKLFYSVKGTPKVLDYMESALGLEFIPDLSGKKYTYDSHRIGFEIAGVESFNLKSFTEAQEKFLGALLYYNELTAVLQEARLIIEENLEADVSVLNWNYTHNETRNIEL